MKTKKLFKNVAVAICSAAMALTMMVGSASVALADTQPTTSVGTIDNTYKGTLTIHKYDYNGTTPTTGTGKDNQSTPEGAKALAGVQFSYVKIADFVTVDTAATDSSNVTLKYKATAAGAKIGLTANTVYTQKDIEDALSAINGGTNKNITKDTLEGATDYTGTITTSDGTAAGTTKGVGSQSGLDLGLYLVVETKVPQNVTSSTDPFLVSIPMTDSVGSASGNWNYDVHVYPKNQTGEPDIDKKVKDDHDTAYANDTTVSMGDTISYQITSKLPKITTKSTYLSKYEFVDTLPAGLSYIKDGSNKYHATITVEKTGSELSDITLTEVTDYTVAVDGQKMTITLTNAGLVKLNPSRSEKTMTITYDATVKSTNDFKMGAKGNTNSVTLTYARTNSAEATLTDTARVYTYGLDLTKTFSDSTADSLVGDPTNVEFILSRVNKDGKDATDTTTAVPATVEYVTSTTSATAYYATGTTASKNSATHFKPDADGHLYIYGLEADTYTLTEVKTDAGYSLLKGPITIVISKTADTETTTDGVETVSVGAVTATVDSKSVTVKEFEYGTTSSPDKSANSLVPLSIVNTKSFTLPATGGLGAIICTVLGAFAIGGAIVVLSRSKKKAE